MNNGATSCAFYVSSVLTLFGVFKNTSSTVPGAIEKLEQGGREKTDAPEPGDVLVCEKRIDAGEEHYHTGFYIGDEKAVSTSSSLLTPVVHDYLYRDSEEIKIIAIYLGRHLMPDNIRIIED